MKIPFLDLKAQYPAVRKPIQDAIGKILDRQHFILGDEVAELEERVARWAGVPHAVAVASGSDALWLTLLGLGIGPGDEVITTPFTFFATAGSISRAGARPVFVDIDPESFNISARAVERALSRKTKAVIAVHLFGRSADMGPLLRAARKRGVPVIEDAAQAFGARCGKRPVGSVGRAGTFSFFPTKNLGGYGDGGMVVTSDGNLAERLRLLRVHGSRRKYIHEEIGTNSRLDTLQAGVLLAKLPHVKAWNQARWKRARIYNNLLAGLPLVTPAIPAGEAHVFHQYVIRTARRDDLGQFLKARGVETGVYYPLPLHLQPCYQFLGYRRGSLPESERASQEVLSLPMYPELTLEHQRAVARAIRDFYADGKRISWKKR